MKKPIYLYLLLSVLLIIVSGVVSAENWALYGSSVVTNNNYSGAMTQGFYYQYYNETTSTFGNMSLVAGGCSGGIPCWSFDGTNVNPQTSNRSDFAPYSYTGNKWLFWHPNVGLENIIRFNANSNAQYNVNFTYFTLAGGSTNLTIKKNNKLGQTYFSSIINNTMNGTSQFNATLANNDSLIFILNANNSATSDSSGIQINITSSNINVNNTVIFNNDTTPSNSYSKSLFINLTLTTNNTYNKTTVNIYKLPTSYTNSTMIINLGGGVFHTYTYYNYSIINTSSLTWDTNDINEGLISRIMPPTCISTNLQLFVIQIDTNLVDSIEYYCIQNNNVTNYSLGSNNGGSNFYNQILTGTYTFVPTIYNITTTTSTGTPSFNFTTLPKGIYDYNATIYDSNGPNNNTPTYTNTTIIPNFDNTTYNISFPYINNYYTTNPNLTYGINSSDIYYNHTIFMINYTNNNTIYRIFTTTNKTLTLTLPDGKYYYALTSYDKAANYQYYDPNITIDTIYPQIALTPTSGTIQYTNTTIQANITLIETNFNYTTLNIFNSTNSLVASITNTTNKNTSYNYQTLIDGGYNINATTCDLSGQCNTTGLQTITIDNKKVFRFVSNLGAQLINNRVITLNDTTNNKFYTTTNGTLTFNITTTNTNFTITVNSSYATTTYNATFSTAQDVYIISLVPTITLNFMDEATLQPFNMSSPNSMTIEIIYTDGNTTTIILSNTTPTTYQLNITSAISTIRFLEHYTTPNIITIYRTYLTTIAFDINNLQTNIWLVDLRTTDVILNTLQIFDLMQDYQNPKVLVTKVMNGTEQTITGDVADVEGKIDAFLLTGSQYNIKIFSDNQPTRIVGKYYADIAGVKYLRLFNVIGTDQTSATNAMDTTYSTYLINASGTPLIYTQHNGTYITSSTWDIYNVTSTGTILNLVVSSSSPNASTIYSIAVPTNVGNNEYLVRLTLNIDCINSSQTCTTPITYEKTLKTTNSITMPAHFDQPYTLKWMIFLFLLIMALSLNFKTANVGSLLLIALAGFLAYIGWFNIGYAQEGSYVVLAIATVVALAGMFKKGSEK